VVYPERAPTLEELHRLRRVADDLGGLQRLFHICSVLKGHKRER
jgi:hypothetical protein